MVVFADAFVISDEYDYEVWPNPLITEDEYKIILDMLGWFMVFSFIHVIILKLTTEISRLCPTFSGSGGSGVTLSISTLFLKSLIPCTVTRS